MQCRLDAATVATSNTPSTDSAKPAVADADRSRACRPQVPARARRRRGGRAAVCGRLRRAAAATRRCSIWHLYQAALAGRDIYYDQRYAHNLEMRDVLEEILTHPAGVDPATLAEIQRYTKLFWINTGPTTTSPRGSSCSKCTPEAFAAAAQAAAEARRARSRSRAARRSTACSTRLQPLFFDPTSIRSSRTRRPGAGKDILASSANNLYVGVTMADLEGFDEQHPLNSRLVKTGRRARRGGLPRRRPLRRADPRDRRPPRGGDPVRDRADGERAAGADQVLSRPAKTPIAWRTTSRGSQDKDSPVDTINGFIEVYMDPRGIKGAWEALVFYVNRGEDRRHPQARRRRAVVRGSHAVGRRVPQAGRPRHHRQRDRRRRSRPATRGRSRRSASTCRTIRRSARSTAASRCRCRTSTRPTTSRRRRSSGSEFAWTPEEAARAEKWSSVAGELTTDMHEVIGHGSGKIAERLKGSPQTALKEQYSALEEVARRSRRAVLPARSEARRARPASTPRTTQEIVQAEYEGYARNALVQLRRVREGTQIEEDHMRNRQMIVRWLMANTERDRGPRSATARPIYVMVDADGVPARASAGCSPRCSGSRPKATTTRRRTLFETYGVHFDPSCATRSSRASIACRLPSYTGFVQPQLDAGAPTPTAQITDVTISYPMDLTTQMLEYSGRRH